MEDIRTKSENTTPRQRAAAQIPKEAMRQLWLRSKEKGRIEIESTADGQQGGQYSEANQTGEKVSDALQSVGKSSAKVAVHKGRELAKKRAGQRHMEQTVERQEQTGQHSFSELQAPDGGQVSSNLTEPRECSVPSGKENPSANHSRISDSAKQTSDRNIKSNRLSVKEKPHDIKTAPHEIRGVSRDRKQIRTAASTVQAEQFTANISMGDFDLGLLAGVETAKVEAAMGDIGLTVDGRPDDYALDLQTTMGNVVFNGRTMSSIYTQTAAAPRSVTLTAPMGDVVLTTTQ